MPPDDLRLSVYNTSSLSETEIWAIGKAFVGNPQGKAIKARADLSAQAIRETALDVVAVPDPHPRHAEVVGWPEDRTKHRLLAMRLAQGAKVEAAPSA